MTNKEFFVVLALFGVLVVGLAAGYRIGRNAETQYQTIFRRR